MVQDFYRLGGRGARLTEVSREDGRVLVGGGAAVNVGGGGGGKHCSRRLGC